MLSKNKTRLNAEIITKPRNNNSTINKIITITISDKMVDNKKEIIYAVNIRNDLINWYPESNKELLYSQADFVVEKVKSLLAETENT